MKKLTVIFLIAIVPTLMWGQSITDIFKTMPAAMLPGFSDANKTMLLVDTTSSVIPYPLGNIELTGYSEDFLAIKTSSAGTMQIKLLPLINDSKIVCVIKTVCGDFCDSNIQFFSTDWQALDKKPLLPTINKQLFLDMSQQSNTTFQHALASADILPISMQMAPDNLNLTLTYNITDYLSKEDAQALQPFIARKEITLSWNKSRFE